MQVVVTGGTGFVGNAVVRLLFSEGWPPRILRRGRGRSSTEPRDAVLSGPGAGQGSANVRHVDFSRDAEVIEACRDAQVLVHLVGIISECGDDTFEAVHVGLTRTMVEAARAAGVRRFIHMSAMGTREGARSRYHRTKWAAEEIVRGSGLDWTIFRPSLIYGSDDAFTQLFARMSRFSPFLPAIGGGRGLLQPIAVEQVARAFVRAMAHPGAVGRTYDLCGPERRTFRQVLRSILDAQSRRRAIVTIPFPVARLQARMLEFLWPRVLGKAPPLNREQILMLEEDNIGDGGAADAAFGLVHVPFSEALRRAFGGRRP